MSMNTAFSLDVVAKFGHEIMDRVRVDQANKLKQDKKVNGIWESRYRLSLLEGKSGFRLKAAIHTARLVAYPLGDKGIEDVSIQMKGTQLITLEGYQLLSVPR